MTDDNSSETNEIPKIYEPAQIEARSSALWSNAHDFNAIPDERENRYVIMMPLPNVTGALHMGHAMDNVMQDLLIRWHRMLGDNTLWMPGTDHAGIATQAVVEKRLKELEGKTRHEVGREGLVQRIWEWKQTCQSRIVNQLKSMGASCDWDRMRFTMDKVCARAVRETFFRLFKDGLIYRGDRLVNWDCFLRTAVADDEIEHKTIQGHFWHLKYPVIDPQEGEPDHVIVATTRPETMLGDTAVACHPDPAAQLGKVIRNLEERLEKSSKKDRTQIEAELHRVKERRETHLPRLEKLVEMARAGRKIRLPLLDREIPLICDIWAKPELGSGCVKVTPAHDPNDYDVWTRNKDLIEVINILNEDGTFNDNAGPYANLDRFVARDRVVEDLQEKGLLQGIEDREVEIGHSDRSKTPIEPYLSKQWFVRMGDVEGGITLGRGTELEFKNSGLAQAAIDAVRGDWTSGTGRKLTFHPSERYGDSYCSWLAEKRDWCISRQLWWGHQIPIWHRTLDASELKDTLERLPTDDDIWVWIADSQGEPHPREVANKLDGNGPFEIQVGLRGESSEKRHGAILSELGLEQDPDVLDTWFSSAIWPHSTLGWPDPETAEIDEGQLSVKSVDGKPNALDYYYPGSCLVTGRDIITLWVARMVIAGLYNLGDLPFTSCFIHANILDGKGERMSKSKGNGIDPVDIIERYGADAMRYVICDMQTGTQDIRLPVQALSPYTGETVELTDARHGRSIFTYICPKSGKEFDVLGTMPDIPSAKIISDRFEIGRNFCTKLWNALRFALMNLGEHTFTPVVMSELADEDRWILSRLSCAVDNVTTELNAFNPSAAIGAAREFFWSELCDWYLELIKPRMREEANSDSARTVLSFVMDNILRYLHPFVPFITEELWQRLGEQVPVRGLTEALPTSPRVINASWPRPCVPRDEILEADFTKLQELTRAIREMRSSYNIPPSKPIEARIKMDHDAAGRVVGLGSHLENLARLSKLTVGPDVEKPSLAATQVLGDMAIYLLNVVDPEKERERLVKQQGKLAKDREALERKLNNENFVSRAPADVVETNRRKLSELVTQLELLEKNLADLDEMAPAT